MNQNVFTYKGYEIISTLPQEAATKIFDRLKEQNYINLKTFLDNKQRLVQKIKIDGFEDMILKIPRARSNRIWERMLTLFRESEAFRNYESMLQLEKLGLKGATPILAAQKRFRGVVIESFFTYSFITGEAPKEEETQKVLQTMQILHNKGYTRSDPKLQNFIMHDDEVYFIDFRLKKPLLFSKIACTMNLCQFLQTLPNDTQYMTVYQKDSLFFKAIYRWHELLMLLRSTRQKIKKALRKK